MRLLYLSPSSSMGGAERVLFNLLTMVRCERPEWPVGLIAASEGPLVERARRLGVETIVLPFPRGFARLGDASAKGALGTIGVVAKAAGGAIALGLYAVRLKRRIVAFAPDVVHSNGFKMHVLGALTRPRRAALIWHFHDYLGARPVASRLIRQLARRCTLAVAVSESVAGDLRQHLGDGVDIQTVPNAIDTAHFVPEGPKADLDALAGLPPAGSGVVRVGLVATFARWKGQLLFLRVLQALVPQYNVRGYIVGGPVYQTDRSQFSIEELRESAARLGLSHAVGLTGFVEDSASVFRALDVVVHASTSPEPFGLVIAEAMAVGKSVVVSASGGASELVAAERDALTFAQGDGEALARQLGRLIADASLRRRLGGAAREAAGERFDPARFLQQMFGLYGRFEPQVAA